MELDIDGASEASDGDRGLGWAQQEDSCASLPALSPVQQAAAADCTFAPSAAARDGSSLVSDASSTPYQLPSGNGARATIWAPAGFKQPTYRSVQFRPPSAPGEAATLQQPRVQLYKSSEHSDRNCHSGSDDGNSDSVLAASVAASVSPPWRFSTGEVAAAAAQPKSAEDKLPPPASFAPAASCGQQSGAPWAACQTPLPVFEEITSATAPISERTQPSYEGVSARRPVSAVPGYRDEVSAHGIERLPQDSVLSGSRRSSNSSISAAETCGAEDYDRSSSIVADDAGGHPLVMPQHRKSALPPAVAPKPSKGVRLFIARQHREAESQTVSDAAECGEVSPTLPPSQPRLLGGSRSTDDEDVASVTSDAGSTSSATGKCLPLVPPKPKLRPKSSQPTSAAAAASAGGTAVVGEDAYPMRADVNNAGSVAALSHGQHYFSSMESPASGAGGLVRNSDSSCNDVGNQQQFQQPAAAPVLRPRARPPEPPCDVGGVADGSNSAGGSKRKSLYEIVSTEGRRGSLK